MVESWGREFEGGVDGVGWEEGGRYDVGMGWV